ncbi:MAG: asparaginase [Alphaproteobacteria bacterium]|nr:asparaginase [Alphaproteobacteria bacterium]
MARKRLLFIHTGGTLGMTPQGNPGPLAPSEYAENVLPFVRGLDELVEIEGVGVSNIDSSDMTPDLWEAIARRVAQGMERYDGFVIIHGTDTMAFTASALSYLLQDLPRPVVLTGSQRPVAALRGDARQNLIHASICATLDIPEVGIWFDDALLRGNRATKVSVTSYRAFASPGLAPLVRMGVDEEFPTPARRPRGRFTLRSGFSTKVVPLALYPGAPAKLLDLIVDMNATGILLQGFGAGNVPLDGWPAAIRRATDAGVPVVITTQCLEGAVDLGAYAGSAAAKDAGALSAGPMTYEAALTKTMFLLGQGLDPEGFRAAWSLDLAGERETGGARPGSW